MATRLRTQDEALERYDAGAAVRRFRRPGEELQGVDPGGVRAEGLDVARGRRELLGCGSADAVLRRDDDRRREAAKVRSAAVKRSPHRGAVAEARGDRVEGRQHAPAVLVGVLDRQLAPRPADGERVEPVSACASQRRDALVVVREHQLGCGSMCA